MTKPFINTGDYSVVVEFPEKVEKDDKINIYRASNKQWRLSVKDKTEYKKAITLIITHYVKLNPEAPSLEGVEELFLEEEIIGEPLDKYIREKHTQEECSGFIDGYKAASQSRRYTEEDMMKAIYKGVHWDMYAKHSELGEQKYLELKSNAFIQSLSKPKLPVAINLETKELIYS